MIWHVLRRIGGRMICTWCDEDIEPKDRADVIGIDWHIECAIRQVCGSEAHVHMRCSCYVPGSTEGDDPTISKREAARRAADAFKAIVDRGYRL